MDAERKTITAEDEREIIARLVLSLAALEAKVGRLEAEQYARERPAYFPKFEAEETVMALVGPAPPEEIWCLSVPDSRTIN